MPAFSPWLAKNARLEVQDGSDWWRFPGLSGVTKGQDPAPRTTVPSWDGDVVTTGALPTPTLDFAGTTDFLHRALIKAALAATDGSSLTFRLITDEVSKGSAITGAGNTLTVVRNGTTKFGTLTLQGDGATINAVGVYIKQGSQYFKVEEIAKDGTITASKYDAGQDDRKAADPTQAAIASYSPVLPAVRIGPFVASVSSFNDLTQDGDSPFNLTMQLSPSAALPLPVIHT